MPGGISWYLEGKLGESGTTVRLKSLKHKLLHRDDPT
jgi:hypothetical protein